MEELAGPMNMCELCDYVTPRPDLMAKHRFVVYKGSSCATGGGGGGGGGRPHPNNTKFQ
jgi:hypothetical protein